MAVIKIVPMPGAVGDKGDEGAVGPQGQQGETGLQGPAGADALWSYNGPWQSNASYAEGDIVTYQGQLYYTKSATTAGTLPTDTTKFDLIASKGADGIDGQILQTDSIDGSWDSKFYELNGMVPNLSGSQIGYYNFPRTQLDLPIVAKYHTIGDMVFWNLNVFLADATQWGEEFNPTTSPGIYRQWRFELPFNHDTNHYDIPISISPTPVPFVGRATVINAASNQLEDEEISIMPIFGAMAFDTITQKSYVALSYQKDEESPNTKSDFFTGLTSISPVDMIAPAASPTAIKYIRVAMSGVYKADPQNIGIDITQYIQGPQGEPGTNGTNGTNGADFGIYYLGNYNPNSGYVPNIAVVRGSDGQLYLAKASGQLGDPVGNSAEWEVWIPKGADGINGADGADGAPGADGADGADALWNYTGEYNGGASYAVGDIATYDGQLWYRVGANGGNVGDIPSPGFWNLLAAKGQDASPLISSGSWNHDFYELSSLTTSTYDSVADYYKIGELVYFDLSVNLGYVTDWGSPVDIGGGNLLYPHWQFKLPYPIRSNSSMHNNSFTNVQFVGEIFDSSIAENIADRTSSDAGSNIIFGRIEQYSGETFVWLHSVSQEQSGGIAIGELRSLTSKYPKDFTQPANIQTGFGSSRLRISGTYRADS